MGVFARFMMSLAEQAPNNKTISIDARYLKVLAACGQKGGRGRPITARQGIAQQCPERAPAPRAA
ncbi:hypothetical protein SAMN05216236_11477 [Sedimentitalea nanhaiensis]|uniref:Transposase n=1 Tax=Sedimentitalea nanhaiensis TaxID=999627 RepID=A0A1I7C597_9RHOB|nr:hypothetical protein SAMN05216236_11477 [Sedimentitalea nanhaiensis]